MALSSLTVVVVSGFRSKLHNGTSVGFEGREKETTEIEELYPAPFPIMRAHALEFAMVQFMFTWLIKRATVLVKRGYYVSSCDVGVTL